MPSKTSLVLNIGDVVEAGPPETSASALTPTAQPQQPPSSATVVGVESPSCSGGTKAPAVMAVVDVDGSSSGSPSCPRKRSCSVVHSNGSNFSSTTGTKRRRMLAGPKCKRQQLRNGGAGRLQSSGTCNGVVVAGLQAAAASAAHSDTELEDDVDVANQSDNHQDGEGEDDDDDENSGSSDVVGWLENNDHQGSSTSSECSSGDEAATAVGSGAASLPNGSKRTTGARRASKGVKTKSKQSKFTLKSGSGHHCQSSSFASVHPVDVADVVDGGSGVPGSVAPQRTGGKVSSSSSSGVTGKQILVRPRLVKDSRPDLDDDEVSFSDSAGGLGNGPLLTNGFNGFHSSEVTSSSEHNYYYCKPGPACSKRDSGRSTVLPRTVTEKKTLSSISAGFHEDKKEEGPAAKAKKVLPPCNNSTCCCPFISSSVSTAANAPSISVLGASSTCISASSAASGRDGQVASTAASLSVVESPQPFFEDSGQSDRHQQPLDLNPPVCDVEQGRKIWSSDAPTSPVVMFAVGNDSTRVAVDGMEDVATTTLSTENQVVVVFGGLQAGEKLCSEDSPEDSNGDGNCLSKKSFTTNGAVKQQQQQPYLSPARSTSEETPSATTATATTSSSLEAAEMKKLRVNVKKIDPRTIKDVMLRTSSGAGQDGGSSVADQGEQDRRKKPKRGPGRTRGGRGKKRRSELDKLLEAGSSSFHFETAKETAHRLGPIHVDVTDEDDDDKDGEDDVEGNDCVDDNEDVGGDAEDGPLTRGKDEENEPESDEAGDSSPSKPIRLDGLLKKVSPRPPPEMSPVCRSPEPPANANAVIPKKRGRKPKQGGQGKRSGKGKGRRRRRQSEDGEELPRSYMPEAMATELAARLAGVDGDEVNTESLTFSFERTPFREGWFRTYTRQDQGEEIIYYPEPKSFQLLPYELPMSTFYPKRDGGGGGGGGQDPLADGVDVGTECKPAATHHLQQQQHQQQQQQQCTPRGSRTGGSSGVSSATQQVASSGSVDPATLVASRLLLGKPRGSGRKTKYSLDADALALVAAAAASDRKSPRCHASTKSLLSAPGPNLDSEDNNSCFYELPEAALDDGSNDSSFSVSSSAAMAAATSSGGKRLPPAKNFPAVPVQESVCQLKEIASNLDDFLVGGAAAVEDIQQEGLQSKEQRLTFAAASDCKTESKASDADQQQHLGRKRPSPKASPASPRHNLVKKQSNLKQGRTRTRLSEKMDRVVAAAVDQVLLDCLEDELPSVTIDEDLPGSAPLDLIRDYESCDSMVRCQLGRRGRPPKILSAGVLLEQQQQQAVRSSSRKAAAAAAAAAPSVSSDGNHHLKIIIRRNKTTVTCAAADEDEEEAEEVDTAAATTSSILKRLLTDGISRDKLFASASSSRRNSRCPDEGEDDDGEASSVLSDATTTTATTTSSAAAGRASREDQGRGSNRSRKRPNRTGFPTVKKRKKSCDAIERKATSGPTTSNKKSTLASKRSAANRVVGRQAKKADPSPSSGSGDSSGSSSEDDEERYPPPNRETSSSARGRLKLGGRRGHGGGQFEADEATKQAIMLGHYPGFPAVPFVPPKKQRRVIIIPKKRSLIKRQLKEMRKLQRLEAASATSSSNPSSSGPAAQQSSRSDGCQQPAAKPSTKSPSRRAPRSLLLPRSRRLPARSLRPTRRAAAAANKNCPGETTSRRPVNNSESVSEDDDEDALSGGDEDEDGGQGSCSSGDEDGAGGDSDGQKSRVVRQQRGGRPPKRTAPPKSGNDKLNNNNSIRNRNKRKSCPKRPARRKVSSH